MRVREDNVRKRCRHKSDDVEKKTISGIPLNFIPPLQLYPPFVRNLRFQKSWKYAIFGLAASGGQPQNCI